MLPHIISHYNVTIRTILSSKIRRRQRKRNTYDHTTTCKLSSSSHSDNSSVQHNKVKRKLKQQSDSSSVQYKRKMKRKLEHSQLPQRNVTKILKKDHTARSRDHRQPQINKRVKQLTFEENVKLQKVMLECDYQDYTVFRKLNKSTWITKSSMTTLLPSNLLNDEVINFIFQLMQNEFPKKSLFLNTYFYVSLTNSCENRYNFKNVSNWTMFIPKDNIFQLKQMFIPCHLNNNHWVCVIVDFEQKIIDYYDSIGDVTHTKVTNCITQYLKDVWNEIYHNDKFITNEWNVRNNFSDLGNFPIQDNLTDCGVYMCVYVYYRAHNIAFNFSCKDIVIFRRRLALSIIQCDLSLYI